VHTDMLFLVKIPSGLEAVHCVWKGHAYQKFSTCMHAGGRVWLRQPGRTLVGAIGPCHTSTAHFSHRMSMAAQLLGPCSSVSLLTRKHGIPVTRFDALPCRNTFRRGRHVCNPLASSTPICRIMSGPKNCIEEHHVSCTHPSP
jgi:hypothetical protein